MHSFIRTYPSLASAASGSAASSSNISRLGEEDENGSICCDIYIDGEDTSQIQKGGSSTSSKPLHVAAVLRGRGIPPEPAPEPEKRGICSCLRLTLILAAIVVGAIVLGVSVGESYVKATGAAQWLPLQPHWRPDVKILSQCRQMKPICMMQQCRGLESAAQQPPKTGISGS